MSQALTLSEAVELLAGHDIIGNLRRRTGGPKVKLSSRNEGALEFSPAPKASADGFCPESGGNVFTLKKMIYNIFHQSKNAHAELPEQK